jgi:hypothetical protein
VHLGQPHRPDQPGLPSRRGRSEARLRGSDRRRLTGCAPVFAYPCEAVTLGGGAGWVETRTAWRTTY